MNSTIHCLGTYLRPGDVIDMGPPYGHCKVEMVNDCRARIRPIKMVQVEIDPMNGKRVSFKRPSRTLDISPNSEMPKIREGKTRHL
jgi:hypothetical protein